MSHKYTSGFTLIEILVVIVIMTTLFMFVSPIGIRQVEKAKAEQELYELVRLIKRYSMMSFTSGHLYTLHFQNDMLKINDVDEEKRWQFSALYFPKQEFVFNRSGLLDSRLFTYQINGNNYSIDLQVKLIAKDGVYVYAP